jgi:hypothetical protein
LNRVDHTDGAIPARGRDQFHSIDRRLDLRASRTKDQERRERTAVHKRGHTERSA